MKTTHAKGLWKAIVFLAVAIFCLSCEGCEEPLMKPNLEVRVETVADEEATIVASLIPNQPGTTISWRYKEEGSVYSAPEILPIEEPDVLKPVKVDWQISDLKANTIYIVEVVASNVAGVDVKEVSFTSGKALARIGLRQAEEIKLTTAKLTAWFVPSQPETEFTFEYKEGNSIWSSYTLPTKFSGTDSIKVSFDLLDLKKSTVYSFRTRANNVAGEVVSDEVSFKTYAAVDADGNFYHEVVIGTQTWLESNLKTTKYANGDPISMVTDQAAWESLTTPGMCWYDNDPKNGEIYGGLYNWHVGADSRALIDGWHVPSYEEFETLVNHLGGQEVAGGKLKSVGFDHWVEPNAGATNESGFTALPGGVRNNQGFESLGYGSLFWAKTIFPVGGVGWVLALTRSVVYSQFWGDTCYKGESIRLVKN